ncbi:hypothetical protein VNI00_014966 [Paramarasmius palmivorus]|uniref:Uncharacterized protein n=1 Tax=Paramarasmius palmivorus TaxID=297713 RepID=A0AAW0BR17_9AGAR
MKHGSFGAPASQTDLYYCAGSDNFCGYLWKIPPAEELVEKRAVLMSNNWQLEGCNTVGFTENMTALKYVPVELATPSAVLKGHNSIVNTTLIHPYFPLIATAGIERDIRLHNPIKSAPFSQEMELSPTEVRQLTGSSSTEENVAIDALLLGSTDPTESDDSEWDTIKLFDRILRHEGGTDSFDVRPWVPDVDSDADDTEDEKEEC